VKLNANIQYDMFLEQMCGLQRMSVCRN